MRLWIRNNSLSLVFGILFAAALFGQSVAGHRTFNDEQRAHGEPAVSYARYVVSSDFGEAVTENWQSEYLQFSLFILATIWLIQRGSNESKRPEDAGQESDARQLLGEHAQRNSPRWATLGAGGRGSTRTPSCSSWRRSSSEPGSPNRRPAGRSTTTSKRPMASPRCRGRDT